MVWLDTEDRVGALSGLHKAFPIGALQGDSFEEDHHDEVETPDFVSLAETVDSAHFSLLIRVGEDAARGLLPRDGEHKVLPVLGPDVLAQLGQQARSPLLLHFRLLVEQLIFDSPLLVFRHPFLVFLEVLAFPGLEVEPGVGEGPNMREEGLNERMEFILKVEN